eukprot:gb/GEZN01014199.1/.p1 GENE.gb/GEZN01014199.1/~~gb/GEZN01014199.1/.p1  ORF type:complete len:233 (+),score=40.78 gb/GEZN01014199.1/:25-723(+)
MGESFGSTKLAHMAFAAVVGAILGIGASFTVNATLVEISINDFFAVYFGLLFVLIAGILLWRVRSGDHPRPVLLTIFSLMVGFSGVLCFFLEKLWFINMSAWVKIPLYSLLGVSVCFALLFSVIDLINYCTGLFCQSPNAKALVETEKQVYLVVASAVVMGFLFGLLFGLMDVEDQDYEHLRSALMVEERLCYPIGALVGGTASAYNQKLREETRGYQFDPVADDDLDADFM